MRRRNMARRLPRLPAVDTVKQVERTAEGALIKATIPRAGHRDGADAAGLSLQRDQEGIR